MACGAFAQSPTTNDGQDAGAAEPSETSEMTGTEPAELDMPKLMPRQDLLNPRDFPGKDWSFFSGKKDAKITETWTLHQTAQGPVLICRGEPHGYIRTVKPHRNFEFGLEWKYPSDENGNSGVLLFTDNHDKIWPTAVQVQLHTHKTGSIVVSGAAELENEIQTKNGLARTVNHWNELVILSQNGRMELKINGKYVGSVNIISPQSGRIGLQSEGSEVHFRNVWLRDLPGNAAPNPAKTQKEVRLRKSSKFFFAHNACATYPWMVCYSSERNQDARIRGRRRGNRTAAIEMLTSYEGSWAASSSSYLIAQDPFIPAMTRTTKRRDVAHRNSLADGTLLSDPRGDHSRDKLFLSTVRMRRRPAYPRRNRIRY